MDHNNIVAGANASEFPLFKANIFANGLLTQYSLANPASNREEFVTKLDKAIKELQGKVNKAK